MMEVTRSVDCQACRSVSFNVQVRYPVNFCSIETLGHCITKTAMESCSVVLLFSPHCRLGES